MIKQMAVAVIYSIKVLSIMVSGKIISKMGMVQKYGQTEQNMKVVIEMGKKVEKGNLLGQMGLLLKVILLTILQKDKVFTNGLMVGTMQENGKKIKCMVKVFFNGLMVEHIKVALEMIKEMVLVSIIGQMVEDMKAYGKMGNRMEKVSCILMINKPQKGNG